MKFLKKKLSICQHSVLCIVQGKKAISFSETYRHAPIDQNQSSRKGKLPKNAIRFELCTHNIVTRIPDVELKTKHRNTHAFMRSSWTFIWTFSAKHNISRLKNVPVQQKKPCQVIFFLMHNVHKQPFFLLILVHAISYLLLHSLTSRWNHHK